MKKIISFFTILTSGVALATLTLYSTSCAHVAKDNYKEFDFSVANAPSNFNQLKSASANMTSIINGNKKYHNGNYILIIGSEANKNSNKFFAGGSASGYVNYTDNNEFSKGVLIQNFNDLKAHQKEVDFGILCTIDTVRYHDIKDLPETLSHPREYVPYYEKWTADDVNYVKKEPTKSAHPKWEKIIKEGEYIRNDKSAKKMRALISYLKTLFTDEIFKLKNESDDNSNLPFALVYKKGVPQKDYIKGLSTSDPYKDINNIIQNVWMKNDK